MLDVWPVLPLWISVIHTESGGADADIIISTLGHCDRIAGVSLGGFSRSQFKRCIALMQEPFMVLRFLHLTANKKMTFVIPDAFLGGSAPLLQKICLCGIRFPSLPRLLSSASGLVSLVLGDIPITGEGHISPDAMATCLFVFTKLQSLTLTFIQQTSSSYPTDRRSPSSAHTILPSLTKLTLRGPHGYLEDIVGRVDAPLLNTGCLEFHDKPIFDTSRVPQFIHRAKHFKSLGVVVMRFRPECISVFFRPSIGATDFTLLIHCPGFPGQVVIMERICAQWPPLALSHVELLRLGGHSFTFEEEMWREVITPWLGLLRPFTAVRDLRLVGTGLFSHVAHVLGELEGERATEVLPALRTIELSHCPGSTGPLDASEVLHALGPFLAAREECVHPVAVNVRS
jgi:hypothetical protein